MDTHATHGAGRSPSDPVRPDLPRTGQGLNRPQSDRLARRATEIAFWGIPAVSAAAMRQAFFDVGGEWGDVAYTSAPATWKFQILTPNSSTLYAFFPWTTAEGPFVVDIPARTTARLFGSLNDAWQVPLVDVGDAGADEGRGGRYLILPPGFEGEVPPDVIPVPSRTTTGYSLLRSIATTPEQWAAARDLVTQVRVHPTVSQGNAPRQTRHLDIVDENFEAVPRFDLSFLDSLRKVLDTEPIQERDLAMVGLCRAIGIRPGMPFKPTSEAATALAAGLSQAQAELVEASGDQVPTWPGTVWGMTAPGGPSTAYSFVTDEDYNIDERAQVFFYACAPPARFGRASFYVAGSQDSHGERLNGSHTYRLRVPPNVPVSQFWAATVYDLTTAGFFRGADRTTLGSLDDPVINDDGTVDIVFGPDRPADPTANWLYVEAGKPFNVMFRFYGPSPQARDGSWTLGPIERVR